MRDGCAVVDDRSDWPFSLGWRFDDNPSMGASVTSARTATYDPVQHTSSSEITGLARTPSGSDVVAPDLDRWVRNFVRTFRERIKQNVRVDVGDKREEGGTLPRSAATKACFRAAKIIAPTLVSASRLKAAAFLEEDGAICIVLQSLMTDRRLSCTLRSGSSAISVVQVDEQMRTETCDVRDNDRQTLKGLARWVIRRA